MITFKNVMPLKNYDSVSLAEQLRAHFAEFYPVRYSERLSDAIQVSSYLHRRDVRRGKRGKLPNPPYIEHPLRVALRLATHFEVRNPDVLIAAILHDTVEDHPKEFAEFEGVREEDDRVQAHVSALEFIAKRFGYSVASIVDDVSNPPFEGKRSKAEKIAAYQAHVEHIVKGSAYSLAVKFSDFVDNAGSLHHHYDYSDKDARYFVQRYSGLIPIYRAGLSAAPDENAVFNKAAMLDRLDAVEQEFDKFKATWTEDDFCVSNKWVAGKEGCPGLIVAQWSGIKCDTCGANYCA